MSEQEKTIAELIAQEPPDEPASEELCSALGIDPNGAADIASMMPKQRRNRAFPPVIPKQEEEPEDSILEICIRSFVEYLADRDRQWWDRPENLRQREVSFVKDAILDMYHDLSMEKNRYDY